MARSARRMISAYIWNDVFFRGLSPLAKLILLGIVTHPMIDGMGGIRQSPEGLARDLCLAPDRKFRAAFSELAPMIEADPDAPVIRVANYLKNNPPDNPNVVRGWLQTFLLLPECETRARLLRDAFDYAWERGDAILEVFAETFADWLEEEPGIDGSGREPREAETEERGADAKSGRERKTEARGAGPEKIEAKSAKSRTEDGSEDEAGKTGAESGPGKTDEAASADFAGEYPREWREEARGAEGEARDAGAKSGRERKAEARGAEASAGKAEEDPIDYAGIDYTKLSSAELAAMIRRQWEAQDLARAKARKSQGDRAGSGINGGDNPDAGRLRDAHADTLSDTLSDTGGATVAGSLAATRDAVCINRESDFKDLKDIKLIKYQGEEERRRLIENDTSKIPVIKARGPEENGESRGLAETRDKAASSQRYPEAAAQRRPEAAAAQRYPEASSQRRPEAASRRRPEAAASQRRPEASPEPDLARNAERVYPAAAENASSFHSPENFGSGPRSGSDGAEKLARERTGQDTAELERRRHDENSARETLAFDPAGNKKASAPGTERRRHDENSAYETLDCADGAYVVTAGDMLAYEACYPEIGDWPFLFRQMKAKLYAVPSSRPLVQNASRWVNCFIRNAASDAIRDARSAGGYR